IKNQLASGTGSEAPFAMRFGRGETFHSTFNNQSPDDAFFVFGPYNSYIGKRCIADPHFGTVEEVVASFVFDIGDHAARVGAMVGFGEAETSHPLAGGKFREIFFALFFGSVGIN